MTVPVAVGLVGLALVVVPTRGEIGRRARAIGPGARRRGRPSGRSLDTLVQWSTGHHRAVSATAGLLVSLPVIVVSAPAAICAGAVTAVLAHHALRLASERAEHVAHDRDIDALAALGAELRAGQAMSSGLRAAALSASEHTRTGFAAAASAVELGADPIGPMIEAESTALLVSVGRMWQLSIDTGCPLADAIEAIELDHRERRRHRLELRSLLAGPSATAGMLALLPVFGLFMGSAIGARPMHTLTQTTVGGLVLIVGTSLTLAGVTWTRLIVRQARSRS